MKTNHIKILSLALGSTVLATAAHAQILVTNTFDSVSGWTVDRYPPAIFQSTPNPYVDVKNPSANVLQIGVSAADYQTSHFFDYQGYKQNMVLDAANLNSIQVQLHLESSWSTTPRVRTGLWIGSATDPTWTSIIGFSNLHGNDPTLEYFDNNLPDGGDWVALTGVSLTYDSWTTLGITVTGANIDFLVDGSVVAEISNGGNTTFNTLAIESENGLTGDPAGVTYSAYYDNLVAPQVVPEPGALSMLVAGAGIFLARGIGRAKKSRS